MVLKTDREESETSISSFSTSNSLQVIHFCRLVCQYSFFAAQFQLRVFPLERPGLGLKEIAQEYNLNWNSSNTEAGSHVAY
ncbi:hypothetical protein PRUPE_8G142800 [Prunus persica]|uniref:Uncharacterized protein n=1 Tax=Prunus persica TaxID=3760 RepID=A0A251MXT2_PRUPE|nr:hypothetical protein PRUPE_8G142800 [Prunus persica]